MSYFDKNNSPNRQIPLLSLIVLFLALQPGNNHLQNLLEYNRTAVFDGELWRLLTGNLVHLDAMHALINALALLLFYIFYGWQLNISQWIRLYILIPIGTSSIILLFFPQIEWFAGFSGALHGLFLCGSLWAWRRDRPEHAIVFIFIFLKVVLEQIFGSFSASIELMSSPVLPETHTAGATVGIVTGVIMRWMRKK